MFAITVVVSLYILAILLGKQDTVRTTRLYVYIAIIALIQMGVIAYLMMTKPIPFS